MSKKSLRSSKGGVSIPGQVERRLERAAAVWKRRCQGATYSTLVAEFGISKTCVHNYIEEQRALLRQESHDQAAREREQALALLDNAIEKIIPHINGEIEIETVIERGEKPPITMTVEEWQARIQACGALTKLSIARRSCWEWMRRSKWSHLRLWRRKLKSSAPGLARP
jgi:hypothetical protein